MQMEGSQILVGWACLESKLCRKVQAGSIPVPSALGELSNWLARQTVNLIPSGLVGSSPTFTTNESKATVGCVALDCKSKPTG